MAVASYLLLEDGNQIELESTSNSFLILESSESTGIILTGQPHPTQAFYTGPRAEQLIPIEFTFRLISCLITLSKIKICVKSALNLITKFSSKLKSGLLLESKNILKVKGTILFKERCDLKIRSSTLIKANFKAGVFSDTKKPVKKENPNKVKELLLKKLREMYGNG